MSNFSFAQKMHMLVTFLAVIVWVGLTTLGYYATNDHQAAFIAAFGDIINQAKLLALGGLGVGVAIADFHATPADITAAAPGETLPKE